MKTSTTRLDNLEESDTKPGGALLIGFFEGGVVDTFDYADVDPLDLTGE
ncbi:hypothetical protein [Cryobacterium sp. PH31-O1]|nr:hypothetical protein [Cryobacterium sp. PH31-O1]MDJ0336641.1 hypothetical protein [Cryobacterium sp. PH31-O1]